MGILSKVVKMVLLAMLCVGTVKAVEGIVCKSISIEMKDGTHLPMDLYLPSEDATNLPCILFRSPAGRNASTVKAYIPLASQGYLIAVQETRSANDAEGKTLPYVADNWMNFQDGHQTLDWLASSPLCNGKIGTFGFSALGITQLLMAPGAPDSLKCQFIGTAPASLYHHAIFPNGILLKNQVEGWLSYYAKDSGVNSFVCNQYCNDGFWRSFDTRPVASQVKAPGIHQTGWYDTFLKGSIEAYATRQHQGGEGARGNQKLIIGPWTHFWPLSEALGDYAVPKEAHNPPFNISPLTWFDYHLKGIDHGISKSPAILYYVMGPFDGSPSKGNVWKNSDIWPVKAEKTDFYLTEESTLSPKLPTSKEKQWSYQQDPKNPVPTLGGLNLFIQSGPVDQRPIESRDDVIVFTSEPLEEDLEVTGDIAAKIFMSTTQPGRTLVVRLSDVYPDGRSLLVCDGIYRHAALPWGAERAKSLQGPQEVVVDLWSTSMVFAKGHRIRISIAGSNYPRFEKSIRDVTTAVTNTIHTGKDYPSRIILPIVK